MLVLWIQKKRFLNDEIVGHIKFMFVTGMNRERGCQVHFSIKIGF